VAPSTFTQRLFSLTGLVPLAAFALLHVGEQFRAAFGGPSAMPASGAHPLARVLLFWAPLTFHALYGIRLCFTPIQGPPAAAECAARGRLLAALGRVTGLFALGFVVLHAQGFQGPAPWEPLAGSDAQNELYATLASTRFGLPLVAAGYVSGLMAVAFHLAYGCYTAALRFGLVRSPRAARLVFRAATVTALGWLALGIGTVVKAATGTLLPF
jgi:succinate dehydrogenase/fumarate reductase cytochrome b subunit